MKLDESCISNPKSETLNWTDEVVPCRSPVQFKVSDFGFEMQDSSNFKMSVLLYNDQAAGSAIYLSDVFARSSSILF